MATQEAFCGCGHRSGTNSDCEICRFISTERTISAELAKARDDIERLRSKARESSAAIDWRMRGRMAERPSIRGQSQIWTDDGDPLDYTIAYDTEDKAWAASFESGEMGIGTLQDCMAACEAAERDGQFTVHPNPRALMAESADKHSNFGTA